MADRGSIALTTMRCEIDLERGDVCCFSKGLGDGFGIAEVEIEHEVAGSALMDLRRALGQRGLGIGHGRQLFDVEHHGFRGVLGLHGRLRHHHGHDLAGETHLVLGQRPARRRLHRRAVTLRDVERTHQRTEARLIEIGGRQDREHARHLFGLGQIDALEEAVRVAAAHHHRIGLARQIDVVGVAALAAQKGRILFAQHGLAHAELHEGKAVVERIHAQILAISKPPHPGDRSPG